MTDSIVVLRCARGLNLAKRITRTEIIPYDRARTFDAWTVSVSGLHDLRELLENLVAAPRCAVVRGRLVRGPKVKGMRRLLYPDSETGELPTLEAVPRRWLALDVEGVARPTNVEAAGLVACAQVAIATLPEIFREAACVVQATAGHGLKPDIRLRLWHWLSRPTSGEELQRWLRGAPVDPAVFRPAQLIYTSAPQFGDDLVDHLPERLVTLPGNDEVEVPSATALAPPPRPEPPPLPQPGGKGAQAYAIAALRNAAVSVATARADSRHPKCLQQSRSLGRLVAAGLLSKNDVEAAMAAAMEEAGKTKKEAAKIVTWALAHPSTAQLPEGIG